ncbi:MAG: type II toxin-antitoxin system ParD family antitoxin [Gallionellaceae bacterium]|jgi:antitoxin ParD1/3/4|nr:type II toxin-antitoxin system ParD family antitoxin [Gallionellaceae bacterium]
MQITVDQHLEKFVDGAVKTGRYKSANEVVSEALRLLESRDEKIAALKKMLDDSIKEGGSKTSGEMKALINAASARLMEQGNKCIN